MGLRDTGWAWLPVSLSSFHPHKIRSPPSLNQKTPFFSVFFLENLHLILFTLPPPALEDSFITFPTAGSEK